MVDQRREARPNTSTDICFACDIGAFELQVANVVVPFDVDRSGSVTPADTLLTLHTYLGLATLTACQQQLANVVAPDRSAITPDDSRCIFQIFLGNPTCVE
jgi:hypothetical protein